MRCFGKSTYLKNKQEEEWQKKVQKTWDEVKKNQLAKQAMALYSKTSSTNIELPEQSADLTQREKRKSPVKESYAQGPIQSSSPAPKLSTYQQARKEAREREKRYKQALLDVQHGPGLVGPKPEPETEVDRRYQEALEVLKGTNKILVSNTDLIG